MKSAQEIKSALHGLIDSIDDEQILNVLNEDIFPLLIENRNAENKEEKLTDDKMKQLDEAIKQADAGDTVSWADFVKATERWQTK